MRVLLTGNLGYIGPVVTAALKAAGHYVIGLDTGWFLPNYASLPVWPDEQIPGDLRDVIGLPRADVVVHLAGLSNDPLGDMDKKLTSDINVRGTLRIADGYPESRHVVVSSCSIYGSADMATEETRPNPLTAYAVAKHFVDFSLMAHVGDAPRGSYFNAVSLRLGTVYGYSPGHRLDLVVNGMTYDAVHGLPITVHGNAARPLVNVEDVARSIVFMLDRPETGVFNVVGENFHMADLASVISKFTSARVRAREADVDQRDYMADGSKLRALGWQPQHTVASTLPDLTEKSLTLSGIPSRYKRLNALRYLIDSGELTPDLHRKEPVAA